MITISNAELMIGDIFEIELKDRNAKVEIFKIGNKQVDILVDVSSVDSKEGVCLIDSLIPFKLTDNLLINDYKFEKRQIKINGEFIDDLLKIVGDYFISLSKVNEKYNVSIKSINGEKICESFNIEYLHTLQNIVRSNIKLEITN